MNIFFLDKDPVLAARYLTDIHLNKMIIESAQMLANCYTKEQLFTYNFPKTIREKVRNHSYFNHPCSKWVRESKSNFNWLLLHSNAIEIERQFRFNKTHFIHKFIVWCLKNIPDNLPDVGPTKPAEVFGDFKEIMSGLSEQNTIQKYRFLYFLKRKKNKEYIAKFTRRGYPYWWNEQKTKNEVRLKKESLPESIYWYPTIDDIDYIVSNTN